MKPFLISIKILSGLKKCDNLRVNVNRNLLVKLAWRCGCSTSLLVGGGSVGSMSYKYVCVYLCPRMHMCFPADVFLHTLSSVPIKSLSRSNSHVMHSCK